MRGHYVVFAVVMVCGLGAVFLLIPGDQELAYLHMKDKVFGTALESYEKKYADGDLSVGVVRPLSKLRLQYGDVNGAIEILERYLERNPGSIDARKQLATLYQWAQRTGDHLRNLEELNRLQPSPENLRRLSSFYNFTVQYEKQIAVLKELVENHPATTKDLMELATLQASLGHFAEATSTLRRLEEQHPEDVDKDVMELWLSLLLDAKDQNQALTRALDWLGDLPDPAAAAQFAYLFIGKRQAALAAQFLQPFEAAADKHPELLDALVRVEMATGKADKAFARLSTLHAEGRLPDAAFESFIQLALGRGDRGLALEASKGRDLSLQSGWVLTSLARAAIAEKRPKAAERMLRNLGKEFLDRRPVLAAELALALGKEREVIRRLALAEAAPNLSDEQKIALANLYVTLDRKRSAIRWLRRLVASESKVAAAEEIAALYLKLGRAAQGLKLFERLRASRPSLEVEAAWARLATGAGKTEAVTAWLDRANTAAVSDRLLTELYFLANEAGNPGLSLAFAERLYRRRQGKPDQLRLAQALTAAGRPQEALPHLRTLLPELAGAEQPYVAALSAAHAKGAPVAAELERFLTRKLVDPALTDEKQEEYAYGLIRLGAYRAVLPTLLSLARRKGGSWVFDYAEAALQAGQKELLVQFLDHNLGRKDLPREKKEAQLHLLLQHGGEAAALPHLRRFAETFAGEWIFAYEEALRKLGRHEELLAFWQASASRTDIPAHEKRGLAFRMLEAGHKQPAENVFLGLAREAPPESPDVSQLLFIWGPRPAPSSLDWLEKRARAASDTAKAGWLNHLVQAGAVERAIAIIEAAPGLPVGALFDAYLNALVAARNPDRLAAVIDRRLSTEKDPEKLRRFARVALQEGQMGTAGKAFDKLLKARPGDAEALKWLGRLAFFDSRYSLAKRYLARYFAAREGDYETNFYYGELMKRGNAPSLARKHYERALRQVEGLSSKPLRARVVRAQLLGRLGRIDDSVDLFEHLLQGRPDDSDLRAEFATFLLDNGRHRRAAQVLLSSNRPEAPDNDPLAAKPARRVAISLPPSMEVEESTERREILLRFHRPVETPDLEKFRKLVPEFVESISSGYDTVLLRVARGAEYKALATPQKVAIWWRRVAKAAPEASRAPVRLGLLQARLFMETGREGTALRLLDRLKENHPRNPRVWASLADLEGRVGRWRRAHEFYGRSLKLDPRNEDFQEARAAVWRQEAPRLRMEATSEDIQNAESKKIYRLSGHWFLDSVAKYLRAGFALEHNHLKIRNVQRSDGRIEPFDGRRWRGEIYLRYDTRSGSWIRGSLYPSLHGMGGGLLYARPDLTGETRLLVDIQRPSWDFVQGVVDDGTLDRLWVQRSQRLGPRLQASLEGALNRYGVDEDVRVATSASLRGGLRYLLRTDRPLISIGYELDKEYRISIEERTDAAGARFNPIPLASREIHSIDLYFSQALIPSLRLDGSGGYAFNRLGQGGPFGGLGITYERRKDLEAHLSFQQGLNPTESSQRVRRLGASLVWRF